MSCTENTAVSGLMNFLKNSPSAFHAVENLRQMLLAQGFTELPESSRWKLSPGGEYFTTRNGSASWPSATARICLRRPLP